MALKDVPEISISDFKKLVKFNITNRIHTIGFGPSGIGKTETIQDAITELGFDSVYWNLATMQPPDFMGLQLLKDDRVEYASPIYLPVKEHTPKPVVVIIDEIDKSDSDIQNPLLEVLKEGHMNGRPLNIQAVMSTANMPDENAFTKVINHALTNRCCSYTINTSFADWSPWAKEHGVDSLVQIFLSQNQDMLNVRSVEGDPTAYVRPSSRSWTNAARAKTCVDEEYSELTPEVINFIIQLMSGFIGHAAAVKFKVWLKFYRHISPNIEALIEKGETPPDDWTVDNILMCGIGSAKILMQRLREIQLLESEEQEKSLPKFKKQIKNVFDWLVKQENERIYCIVQTGFDSQFANKHDISKIPSVLAAYKQVFETLRSPKE